MTTSMADKLLAELDEITKMMDELLDASTIDYQHNRMRLFAEETGVAVAMLTDCQWGPLDDRQRQLQRRTLELWHPWQERVELLFAKDTKSQRKRISDALRRIRIWINREYGSSPPRTIPEAKDAFRVRTEPLVAALTSLTDASGALLVVPDTNVLLRSPDIAGYGAVLDGATSFTVLLVPGVLGELDAHKVNHRNPSIREKARKFSNRIKGWRKQGNLARGVKVQGDIYVRVEGREPNFEGTLSWLDRDIVDDRILASILEVQRQCPGDRVVLLTGDVQMLAKADTAAVPTADTPEPDVDTPPS